MKKAMNFIQNSIATKKKNLQYAMKYHIKNKEKAQKILDHMNLKEEFVIKLFNEFQNNKHVNAAVRKIITYQFWLFLEMVLLP